MWQLWNQQWVITMGFLTFEEGLQKRTLPVTDIGTLGEHWYLSSQGQMVCPCSNSEKELFHELSHEGTHSMKESILRRKYYGPGRAVWP